MSLEREISHLEHFKEIYPDFPAGDIEKSEKPDFVVHTRTKLVGIEHTEIFQPSAPNGKSLQARDSLAQKVVEQASSFYLENNDRPLLVQVMFRPKVNINARDTRIAKAIVRLVVETDIQPGISLTLKRSRENLEYFPGEIVMIHVYRHPNGIENKWRASSSGYIPEITPEQLQEEIDRKEEKLSSYRSRCPEVWLLIVADDRRHPSIVDLASQSISHHYRTHFDRVFFFWNSSRRFVELQLSRMPKLK